MATTMLAFFLFPSMGSSRRLGPAAGLGSLLQRSGADVNGENISCDIFEVCKCAGDWDEANVKCTSGSCTYAGSYPFFCCAKDEHFYCSPAKCFQPKDWKDCEWVNFHPGTDMPGNGIYIDFDPPTDPGQGPFAVMTDIDDTLYCSGGLGGYDKECANADPPKREGIYLGVAAFQLALARGAADSMNPRKVIPMSARPQALNGLGALKSDSPIAQNFTAVATTQGIASWGVDTDNAQYGGLNGFFYDPIAEMVNFDTDATPFVDMGYGKYSCWKEKLASLVTNQSFVFIGDNGQGDAVAAQMMLKRSQGLTTGAVKMAFLHDVRKACLGDACRNVWAAKRIYLFEIYPHAAGIALKQGFISENSCLAVCAAAPSLPCDCSGQAAARIPSQTPPGQTIGHALGSSLPTDGSRVLSGAIQFKQQGATSDENITSHFSADVCNMIMVRGRRTGKNNGCFDVNDLYCDLRTEHSDSDNSSYALNLKSASTRKEQRCLRDGNSCIVGNIMVPAGVRISSYYIEEDLDENNTFTNVCNRSRQVHSQEFLDAGIFNAESLLGPQSCSFKIEALPGFACLKEAEKFVLGQSVQVARKE